VFVRDENVTCDFADICYMKGDVLQKNCNLKMIMLSTLIYFEKLQSFHLLF
jgi:hypothetical protein